jgi:hypothetical protein
LKAVWLRSLLERLGAAQPCAQTGKIQAKANFRIQKTTADFNESLPEACLIWKLCPTKSSSISVNHAVG